MNYKETGLSGTSWVRCNSLTIRNPIVGTTEMKSNPVTRILEIVPANPTISFQEEKVISIDGTQSIIPIPNITCSAEFDAVNGSIQLRNPETGDLLGTSVSHQELYVILYSLYLQTALARDAQ